MKSDYIVLSPFRYERAYRVTENDKGSISRPEIHDLISSNTLTAAHIEIIKVLYVYKYLTSHHIALFTGDETLRDAVGLPVCSLKEAIAFMVKKGLILRHHFSWQETLEDVMTERRSVNYYTLSKGTCIYLQKDLGYAFDVDTYMLFDKDYTIYQRLAINGVVAKYKNDPKCRHNELSLWVPANSPLYNTDFLIDCTIKTHSDDGDKNFVLFAVRRNNGWVTELELKLKLLKDHILFLLAKKQLQEAPAVILLCEDDMHVVETHINISKLDYNFLYYYTTDVRQHNDYTYDKLLIVSSDALGVKYREYRSPFVK